jgi:hypothetical protein
MQSNNIPTAEVVLSYLIPDAKDRMTGRQYENAINAIRAHGVYYVKAALEAASDNATIDDIGSPNGDGEWMYCGIVDKDSILNSYPLENIK